jgi:hypothetical protein
VRAAASALSRGFPEAGIAANGPKTRSTLGEGADTGAGAGSGGASAGGSGPGPRLGAGHVRGAFGQGLAPLIPGGGGGALGAAGSGGAAEPIEGFLPPHLRPGADAAGGGAQLGLPWCGFRVGGGGEVTADYARYGGRGGVADALTLSCAGAPEATAAAALRVALRPRCLPLLLDGHINSRATVARNVFEMALVGGAKLVAALRRLRAAGLALRGAVAARVAAGGAAYLVSLVRGRCPGRSREASRGPALALAAGGAAGGALLLLGPSAVVAVGADGAAAAPRWAGGGVLATAAAEGDEGAGMDEERAGWAWPRAPAGLLARPVPWCPLRRAEVRWLALEAFAQCFDKCGVRRGQGRGKAAGASTGAGAGGGADADKDDVAATLRALRPPPALAAAPAGAGAGAAASRGVRREVRAAAALPSSAALLQSLHFAPRRDA